ncbi:MAG: Holliday junction branch migration protein RuvA [bacterium]|nr:Holliday junction branch migration protein RuvA [bacterium]
MISFLAGKIEFKGEKFAVINVGGVGYRVFASADTLKKIPEKGESVKLWTNLYVREDALELYGFIHQSELELFETLIHVSGIGPKTGLGVMGVAPVDILRRAIASGDTSYLTRVSGIGRKIAEKIILELKEKMAGKGITVEAPELKEEADALEALVSLGYSQREAREALQEVSRDIKSPEKRIKEALKKLGGGIRR